ncbi:5-oxoprolinase subunit PxpB [Leucothrix pacifica]|uniref:Allophanate hydrolase n=1 Tax=Leucothrix pacifica TaxID=1247513 RepID=A0A317CB63_9GAMM|nr:5-oxoprolinase subunit PxpB [Leucothrix pacifica]PWQ95599.1 allophanate hydrolase [Leucothrix pacifica]
MRIEVAGENSLIIYFGDTTVPEISEQVQRASKALAEALGDRIIDQVTSYASLLLIFDPLRCDQLDIRAVIRRTLQSTTATQTDQTDASVQQSTSNCVELPVYYSEESGPELTLISKNSGLSIDEIIALHQSLTYRVYAIGFAPGFAFLGQVDERIATPRLSTPRLKVPRGAIGIADRQTAIYPDVSPGGWNLIGLCPTRMFDPQATPTMPVSVGDEVRFKAISREEFFSLGGEIGVLS